MNFDQIFAIHKANKEKDVTEVVRLLELGNDVEGGLILDPDKYYFYSSYGRIISVEGEDIKLIGYIGRDQRVRVKLSCVNSANGDGKLKIDFPVSDLISKHFNGYEGKPIDILKFMTDHVLFKIRDNHCARLQDIAAKTNAGRKKSNTMKKLVSPFVVIQVELFLSHCISPITSIYHSKRLV